MLKYIKNTVFIMILFLAPPHGNAQETREFYQLKIFHFNDEAQAEVTENFVHHAYLPALKRNNIGATGVFRPREDSINQLYVLLPFSSLEEITSIEERLLEDVLYLENGSEYLNAPAGNPPYERMEVILMHAFKDMPQLRPSTLTAPRKERIYELRSYQAPTEAYLQNKLEMFNEGGEIALFENLGFNAVFYGEVLAGPDMPNLMYLTTFPNRESRDRHWENFGNSPEWQAMANLPQYEGNVSHIDIHFLYPTEYSDY